MEYQRAMQGEAMSYSEYFYITSYFYRLGKRYGLIKEFKENGIIYLDPPYINVYRKYSLNPPKEVCAELINSL
jgi:hypothetical protein